MIKSVVLLTGAVEAPHLTEALKATRPGLAVQHARNHDDLDAAVAAAVAPILLLSYCTNIIVPPAIINTIKARGGRAYNFHPAPPTYPGVGGPQRAVLAGTNTFGVTAHELTEAVDAGAIIASDAFAVPDGITGMGLEQKTYSALFALFLKITPDLLADAPPQPITGATWGGKRMTRAELDDLKKTPPTDSEGAERHARAFS